MSARDGCFSDNESKGKPSVNESGQLEDSNGFSSSLKLPKECLVAHWSFEMGRWSFTGFSDLRAPDEA